MSRRSFTIQAEIIDIRRDVPTAEDITDDGDYSTVSGIQVFTANRNIIESARAQGKLRIR